MSDRRRDMGIFKKREKRDMSAAEGFESYITGRERITRAEAMQIPAVSACVELIADTVSALPIRLLKEADGELQYAENDSRVSLLNVSTGDMLTPRQMKRAWVEDYLLDGSGFIYIDRTGNKVRALRYVRFGDISVNENSDPIFKNCTIYAGGTPYRDFDFLKIARRTQRGITGIGITKEKSRLLSVMYNTLKFEENLISGGGNKKGVLKASYKIGKEEKDELKRAWKRLYGNNSESVVVLNDGIDFKETSNTTVEMQLNQSKEANRDAVCAAFLIPPRILTGGATDEDRQNLVNNALISILREIEASLNRDLLLESEKGKLRYAFDITKMQTGDISKQYAAYREAIDGNFMQVDEVRHDLGLKPLGLKFIKLGLQDVLYDPEKGVIYTPNTNASAKLGEIEKGNKEE